MDNKISRKLSITWQSLHWPSQQGRTMFHPKAVELPDGSLFMTVQEIRGSDYYGDVLWSTSTDGGYHWSDLSKLEPLGWRPLENPGEFEGVCDTVPNVDLATGKLVAIGHNVFYRENRFWDTLGTWRKTDHTSVHLRRGCYSVRQDDGSWGPRQYLEPEEFKAAAAFCCGCTQKIIRSNGEWLLPFYFMEDTQGMNNRVTVYRALFDGEKFTLLERGNILENLAKRGLMEPSLIEYDGRVLITLRAEDGNSYVAVSEDGLHYGPMQAWRFDNGEIPESFSTQQHFLVIGGRLYLSYTRNAGYNSKVMRFRAPLFIAEVDPDRLELIRESEQIVFPIDGEWSHPETIARSGNFMPLSLKDGNGMMFDGSFKVDGSGIAMLARLQHSEV